MTFVISIGNERITFSILMMKKCLIANYITTNFFLVTYIFSFLLVMTPTYW